MYLLLSQVDRFHHFVRSLNRELLLGGSVLLLVLVVLYLVWEAIHRRRRRTVRRTPELAIDVSALDASGPPAAGPQVEFYNLPMRLAVIVVAPAGRVSRLPPLEQIHDVLDAIVPGLADVAVAQQAMLYYWPPQLSSRGFAHGFFRHVPLPGDGGKGTPWCAAAGGFKMGDKPFTAGLVLTAASPNALGQVVIESDTKWLDVLRVKPAG